MIADGQKQNADEANAGKSSGSNLYIGVGVAVPVLIAVVVVILVIVLRYRSNKITSFPIYHLNFFFTQTQIEESHWEDDYGFG